MVAQEVHGQAYGKPYHGLVYAAADEQGQRVSVGIKSSKIDRLVQYPALMRKIGKNKIWFKSHPPTSELKNAVSDALREPTRQGFVHSLHDRGVDAVLWQNDSGYLYGVTYIDHHTHSVFKGSALGREYSAGTINELYNPGVDGDPFLQQETGITGNEVGLIGGLSDIFSLNSAPNPAEDDPESYSDRAKRKRKKKRRQGFF